jgi:hypothetical protein
MAMQMRAQFHRQNQLQERLEKLDKERKLVWKKYDAQMCIFPSLTEDEVRNICFGEFIYFFILFLIISNFSAVTYQIRMAKSYIREHLTESILNEDELEFIAELCAEHDDLLCFCFHSRYSSQKNHIATVQFDSQEDNPIQGSYCTCLSGSREVGCCVHVAAILWHLGVRRAEIDPEIHPLAAGRFLEAVHDSIQHPYIHEDSDDDDRVQYALGKKHNDTDDETSSGEHSSDNGSDE